MIRLPISKTEAIALAKFALIGAVGFSVDAGLLYVGVYLLSSPLIVTRVVSIFVSVIVTWVLNRIWTFNLRNKESIWFELFKYLGSRSVGAATNVGIFSALVSWAPAPFSEPIIATPLSSAVTMIINYTMVRIFIYVPK